MRDLRLVGVHEDGQHLLLSDSEGEPYRVRLDEPLRAAVRRDRPRLGQLQIEIDGGMRPREVQALIRAGFSAEHQVRGADHVLGGVNQGSDGAFYLIVTPLANGSDVAIIVNNGA